MIIFENNDLAIRSASHRHPGFNSAIDLAARIAAGCAVAGYPDGSVIVGHAVSKTGGTGADCFGCSPLHIFCRMTDGSIESHYTFGWHWSESSQRRVLGWAPLGGDEWDIEMIQAFGPVLA